VNRNFEVGRKGEIYSGLAKGMAGRGHISTHGRFSTELQRDVGFTVTENLFMALYYIKQHELSSTKIGYEKWPVTA
jgi:hypothetical protein